MAETDRTASLMSPARLAQLKPKPATTPAAWLTQMAADAGHLHVNRILELGEVLKEQAASTELPAVASGLEQLAAALPALDFSLLEPRGWWARTSGKGRSSGAEFAAQFERIAQAGQSLSGVAQALVREQQADAAPAEHALVELEAEYRAVEMIIDQGARWLQDMRSQLKARQAAASDLQEQQAVLEDSQRCDILVTRLKLLRALCSAASQVPGQARANAERRAALAQTLQQSLAGEIKDWHRRLSTLAAAATAGKAPTLKLEGSIDAHQELQVNVGKAVTACEQLLAQEQALARSIAALGRQPVSPG
ncbi:MAG: hypothetical protein JWQ13_1309 [Ramlibacter sp.]|jgi:hypothetical protein|nr:hypothetical protein [Ramlibacter sp.]